MNYLTSISAVVRFIVLSVFLLSALSSCATRTGSSVAVEDDLGAAVVTAYVPPTAPVYTRAEPGKAVRVLMRRAQDERSSGNLQGAAGTLERALRIEPQNPRLWNKLAHVRWDQKRYQVAAGLAAKSNSFAAVDDVSLRRDNATLIQRSK